MQLLRKRARLAVLALVLAFLSIVAAWGWAGTVARPPIRFTKNQARQINQLAKTTRMTKSDVVAIVGHRGDFRTDQSQELYLYPHKGERLLAWHWISDEGYLRVTFDAKTHWVNGAGFIDFPKPPSFQERRDAWFLWLVQKLGI
jgi:hypothetical protein